MDKNGLLNAAVRAAIEGGKAIREIYNNPNTDFGIEAKADNSPLTIADKSSHNKITSILKETGQPILSEEGESIPFETRKSWKSFWLVDPLDGTKEFIKRNDEFT
ncbi:MAG TPA: inositol monophosphatase family protein, partial [Prolixibacteraceae bacterium]|nr:inositol monophosphatase family protein [Prolixibacteraceae bacterium]